VAFDHPDPSVHVVLSAPLDERGADSLDLVAFPPRWDPTEHTFRPPFHHRNAVTEWNAIVHEDGVGPFRSGRHFLTPCMTPHAVLADRVERAIEHPPERPHRIGAGGLWFQFETTLPVTLTPWARDTELRIRDWPEVWGRYRSFYDPRGAGQP
jgi:homogentisate 1,2-dioxygenase